MVITIDITEGERRLIVGALKRSRNRTIALAKGDARKEELVRQQYNRITDKFKVKD